MPSPKPSDMTASPRELIKPARGRQSCLAELSDDELELTIKWMGEGVPNDRIANTVTELWGRCVDVTRETLLKQLASLKKKAFAKGDLTKRVGVMLDPLMESAYLIRDLKEEWNAWSARADELSPEEVPKSVLEHIDRLGRQLLEAINNHAAMLVRLGKVSPAPKSPQEAQRQTKKLAENIFVQVNDMGGDALVKHLPEFAKGLKQLAKKRTPEKEPRRGLPQ